jgi:uncharacterized protein YggE
MGHCFKKKALLGVFLVGVTGSLYLLSLFAAELKSYQFIGREGAGSQTTISVSGEGRSYATPDTALVSFSITHEAKTNTEARKFVDDRAKAVTAYLKEKGVAEKDIKSTGYNLYPKYEWEQKQIVCVAYPCPQPPGKQVLTGYEVTQSFEVKVRNIDDVGTIVGGVVDKGATNMSGPSFIVDNEDAVKSAARKEAIDKAKAKADELARSLGVTLVRVVSFNEGNDYPIYYGRGGMVEAKMMSADMGAPAPAVMPVGENTFTSNVTIVYEIR